MADNFVSLHRVVTAPIPDSAELHSVPTKQKNPNLSIGIFFISKINYLIISIFKASSWFTESKKPCSFIQSSLNTLLMYLEP